MKTPALIALCLALTACQTFNLDFLKPAAAEEPIEERIPDDPNHAQLYHLMKANRARMKAENPQSKLSHKTIISPSDNLRQTGAADTSGDTPAPVLRYTPARSGKYRASIIMASCHTASCQYSLQTYISPDKPPVK